MVKSILKTLNKKRFVVEMPMPIAKIQSSILSLLPIPPILTKDQCEILSEADNIVSNNHLTLEDLNIKPSDVEEAMKKWLWRFKDGWRICKGLMKSISLLSGYLFLVFAIITGIAANGYLKTTEGFTKINPTIFCITSIIICMFCLSKAMSVIPVGFTYATYGALNNYCCNFIWCI